jgi:D-alanyl-D-alanine carboxypeptidase (penicillin-binding protein 5/6)
VIFNNGECLFGRGENEKKEIASLTKVMTCYTVLKLCQNYEISLKETIITISPLASEIDGTTANLRHKDKLSIWDLLHGLMLPSGNDAGFLLAEYFGELIFKNGEASTKET